MRSEDRLKLEALAEGLGVSRSEVQARGVRLLWILWQRGLLREVVRVPIRTPEGKIVMLEVER